MHCNARAMKTGFQMAANPAASIPEQFLNRADRKVSCRLLDASRGTYEAISPTPDSWPGIVTGEAPSADSVSEVPSEITDALAQNY